MKNKLPYYAGKCALGIWGVYQRFDTYVKLIVNSRSEQEAKDTAYKWNGEYFKKQKELNK
jgi:hypothetical protein